jgi:hypothetical protein
MSVFRFPPIIQIRVCHYVVIVLSFGYMLLSVQSHIIFHINHTLHALGISMLVLIIEALCTPSSDRNGSGPSLGVRVRV